MALLSGDNVGLSASSKEAQSPLLAQHYEYIPTRTITRQPRKKGFPAYFSRKTFILLNQIISPLTVFYFVIFKPCGLKMKEISLESPPNIPKLYLPMRFWVYQQTYVKALVHTVREGRRPQGSGRFQAEPRSQTCCANFWLTSDPKSVTEFSKNKWQKTPAKHISLLSLITFLRGSQNAVEEYDESLRNRMLQL